MENYIQQYQELHVQNKEFGTSSIYLWKYIKKYIQKFHPKTVLDYGCGKGLLAKKIQKELNIKCYCYDVAIPQFNQLPDEKIDFLINTDVLEHIPEENLDSVLEEISSISQNCFFNISCRRAGQTLPNGHNAHCTIYPPRWWYKKLNNYFDSVTEIQTKDITAATFVTRKRIRILKKKRYKNGIREIYLFGFLIKKYQSSKKPV